MAHPRLTQECWCDQPHNPEPDTIEEAWRNLWHLAITELRIDLYADRIEKALTR